MPGLSQRLVIAASATLVTATFAASADAGSLVNIDFNGLSRGTVVTNQFADLGVTFSLLDSSRGDGPIDETLSNVYAPASGIAIVPSESRTDPFSDIELSFAQSIDFFSILSLDSDEPLSVHGYLNDVLVQTLSRPAGRDRQVNEIILGEIGGSQRFDRVVVDVREGREGSHFGGPELFDNLAYNTVPEPSTLLGMGTLALASGTLLRRKRKV